MRSAICSCLHSPALAKHRSTLPHRPTPSQPLLNPSKQLVILIGALLAALFLVLLQLPVPGGAVIMPVLALAWGAGLPLALGAASVSDLPELPEAAERLLPDSHLEVDEERYNAVW